MYIVDSIKRAFIIKIAYSKLMVNMIVMEMVDTDINEVVDCIWYHDEPFRKNIKF